MTARLMGDDGKKMERIDVIWASGENLPAGRLGLRQSDCLKVRERALIGPLEIFVGWQHSRESAARDGG